MTNQIMALADAYATQMIHAHYHPMKEARAALQAEVDRVTAERDALKADAERMVWLEKGMRRIPSGDGGYLHELKFSYFVSLQRLTLRHAIDRAMKGTS